MVKNYVILLLMEDLTSNAVLVFLCVIMFTLISLDFPLKL